MSESIDNLHRTCGNCPVLLPGLVAFMRTMSLEMMSGDIEEAEQVHVFNAIHEQAGDALEEFWLEMEDATDFETILLEVGKRFGPLMVGAIDQAKATFESERVDLSDQLLNSQPGRMVCDGIVEVGGRKFCGAAILKATTEIGQQKQATLQQLNADFVERSS